MKPQRKRVLFIVTSANRVGPHGRETGYEFSEVAHPYLVFEEGGYRVDFASPAGGRPPEEGFQPGDSASVAFRAGPGFRHLNESAALAAVALEDYDSIFFPGGLGPMVDLVDNAAASQAIVQVYERGGVIGAVCHGPAALMDVVMSDGTYFLEGRNVTAFTEAEEIGHSEEDVPFMIDAAMEEQGARHTCAPPFKEHVVIDGRLVTGQNPASAAGVARAMRSVLEAAVT
ncbi:MAG: putative intracellular protease/amidase [Hyphomicrobiaceae bacterium]|jgi:putative intracellular protease/amidase